MIPGDSTLAFLADGYAFGTRRFDRLGTDAFRARLAGQRITLIRGQDAAGFFASGDRFTRQGAMPPSVLHSLQDVGSVQTLDDEAHRARKEAFLRAPHAHEGIEGPATSAPPASEEVPLDRVFHDHWERAEDGWNRHHLVRLLPAVERILLDSALDWLGIDADDVRRGALTRECSALIDGAGAFGPRNWRGRLLRRRSERWARNVATELRGDPGIAAPAQRLLAAPGLDRPEVAAVELLNVIRPTVAVARFVVFAALALHLHPAQREVLRGGNATGAIRRFAQEVRRTTPFFPLVAGRARRPLAWNGIAFEAGDRVALDLFATNRRPDDWTDPGVFDPDRFRQPDRPAVVAQGAGHLATSHRCPGEPMTVDLLEVAIGRLADGNWELPAQDLRVDLGRIPARVGPEGLRMHWAR